jgi:transcriptional regulator with XRE-family HTH domain
MVPLMPFDDSYPEEISALLAVNIRRCRKLLGISLRELDERSMVTYATICRAEAGQVITVKSAAAIAAGLGIPLPDLLRELEE